MKVAERDGDPAGDPDSAYEGDRLTRDELTGVLNRQAGFAALGRDLDRCRRAGERFVIGYLDVDGLKDVNSTDGPRAGDELLRKVTAALRATLRSYDVIMRLGGDEFLFSLPGADMATAELRANEFGVILAEESPRRVGQHRVRRARRQRHPRRDHLPGGDRAREEPTRRRP